MPYKDKKKRAELKRLHYLRNKEAYLERARNQDKASPDSIKKHNSNYYLKNRDAILLKQKGRVRKPKPKKVKIEMPMIMSMVDPEIIKANRDKMMAKFNEHLKERKRLIHQSSYRFS